MKKVLCVTIALCMVLSLGCTASPAAAPPQSAASGNAAAPAPAQPQAATDIPDVIKIGLITPVSGQQAIDGKHMTDAIKLVEQELDAAGGLDVGGKKVKVKFIIEDSEAKPEIAANCAQKMINQEGVLAIIGPNNSSDCLAVGPIVQAAEVPLITNNGTNVKVTQVGDYIFRACYDDPMMAKVVARYIKDELKFTKAACLYDNANAYSTGMAMEFKTAFASSGGELVAEEAFGGADIRDFSAQLTIIKNANPEIVFIPCSIDTVPLIVQQARAMGIDAALIGDVSWDYAELPGLIGDKYSEGLYYATGFCAEMKSAEGFVNSFQDAFGYMPGFPSAMTYDCAKILFNAIQNAKTIDGPGLRDAMAATDIDLPSGHVSYDETRTPVKECSIMKIVGGAPQYVMSIAP